MYTVFSFLRPDPRKFGLPLPAVIPFLDSYSELFYSVNSIYQHCILITSICSAVGQFAVIIVGIMTACCQIDAVKSILTSYNSMIADSTTSEKILTQELIEIIRLHSLVKNYVAKIQTKFGLLFLALFSCIGIVTAMCLNVVSYNLLSSSTCLMLNCISTVLLFCSSGNYLLSVNDGLAQTIYDLDWHKLSISNQKLFIFFLANAQPPARLHALLLPLDMSTFIKIMKASFSYFSILNQR
ncbi:odorant receptor 22b-like [Uranotaenia lowii]|uniref:odorant receptor 22b-like n=1 Tax=Uranotaenia lowii TaxID=190385 RepID=UPI00247A7553|nr:odorant receptor 22b-like [Uranotaenia lowii]